MITIRLPQARKLVFHHKANPAWQLFGEASVLEFSEIISTSPFIVSVNGYKYYFSSRPNVKVPAECNYGLLVSKMPVRKDFEDNKIHIIRWLKHPAFIETDPETIVASWRNKFHFVKEDTANDIKGLRPPQTGAIYSILAHGQNADNRAIIVMPTGTGKTEVMLSSLIVNQCQKLLVAVPSDALRTQLGNKFITLGLLKEFGIVERSCLNPVVGIINSKFLTTEELSAFLTKVNVVVTTMSILTTSSVEQKAFLSSSCSHFFIDEAHHAEATTWKELIGLFKNEKIFLFTATPFRTDDKKLEGKFIFNFSLRKAQEQKYYKKINYLPIRDYNPVTADEKIATKAVEQLRKDILAGHHHIILARCKDKIRAEAVFRFYEQYADLNPVLIYTGVAGLSKKVNDIKLKKHQIIVCVDMLGEGFDLPELKIAAVHDERQSIAITLQFVGRFTRPSYEALGEASFIANVAYPPIKHELDRLYASDSDWNLLLPVLSETATEKEIKFKEFLDGFANLDDSIIPFQSINPALSTVVYTNGTNEWSPNNWREGIHNIDSYDHQFSKHNPAKNTLVIILGQINKVDWGRFDTVQNLEWHMVVVIWDLRPGINRIFINTSIKDLNTKKLVSAIFKEDNQIVDGMDVFKIFHNVNRLAIFNFGGRKDLGKDISFQSFFGRGVQDGLALMQQGTLIKNNIFGSGYKDGEKITLGCSVSGKVWSYLRGNLEELVQWCKQIGETITDSEIDHNTVLQHTLFPVTITERPAVLPIRVDWHPEMYLHSEFRYEFQINGKLYDLSDCELNIVEVPNNANLQFSYDTAESSSVFELILGERIIDGKRLAFHEVQKLSGPSVSISYASKVNQPLTDFFQEFTPVIWFADNSQLLQNRYLRLRESVGQIDLDAIVIDTWNGVNLRHESQGIYPYQKDSIQFYFISKIIDDFEMVYDDDGPGEIADIVGINNLETHIDVHMYHLKFAKQGKVSNEIDNFYQVCGQAQKSLNWKYRNGREFFEHMFRRITKTKNNDSCTRLLKGTEDELEFLLNSAKWTKEMKFHIYIVQPGFNKNSASEEILLLLGSTAHYLHSVGNVELKVYSS